MGSFGPFGNDLFVICDMTFPKDVSELETRVTSTIAFLVNEPSGSDTDGLIHYLYLASGLILVFLSTRPPYTQST